MCSIRQDQGLGIGKACGIGCLRRAGYRLLVSACVAWGLLGPIVAGAPQGKLDPLSEIWVEKSRTDGKLSAESKLVVVVETTSVGAIRAGSVAGFSVRTCFDRFCTGQVTVSTLQTLLDVPSVRTVRVSGVGQSFGRPSALTPVVVAVIDQGIPWRDTTFWSQFGNQILWVWDQIDPLGPAPQTSGEHYGTEVNPSSVERLRARRSAKPSHWGHGARMAVTAAGLGGDPVAVGRVFVNPEASRSVILVNTTGKEAEVLDALEYVVEKARTLGAHCVINLSMSTHTGPHDGTDLFTRAIDSILNDNSQLVVSVGNDAAQKHYIRKAAERDDAIRITVKQNGCPAIGFTKFEAEGWYPGDMALRFSVGSPGTGQPRWIPAGTIDGFRWSAGRALIDTRLLSADQTKRGLHITGEVPCRAQSEARWSVGVRNTSPVIKDIEMWITSTQGGDVLFPDTTEPVQPISALAASHKGISVGAYIMGANQVARPAGFSSEGSTGDGRWKPDLMLLEDMPNKDLPGGGAGGTSAAAAVATRCIAELWAQSAQSTSTAIRKVLQGKAVLPTGSAVVWTGSGRYRPVRIADLLTELRRGH